MHLGQLTRGANELELLCLHDSLQPQLVSACRYRLLPLHHVSGTREERAPVGAHHAPRVVVVKVADDHEVDAVGVHFHGPQRSGGIAPFDSLDIAILVAHPLTGAGLDEDALAAALDQEEVQAAQDPSPLVRLDQPRPEGFRHDAKEPAGIGPEPSRSHDPYAKATAVLAHLRFGRDLVQAVRGEVHRSGRLNRRCGCPRVAADAPDRSRGGRGWRSGRAVRGTSIRSVRRRRPHPPVSSSAES